MPTELLSYALGRMVLQRLLVRVVTGPAEGTTFRTEAREFSIGNQKANDFVIDDPSISGHHLACSLTPTGLRIVDLESKNGTFIGSTRLERCIVAPDTELRLGRSTIRFESSGESFEEALSSADQFGSLVGSSPIMRQLFLKLQRVADSDIGVLIHAETGCGKELVAEALHEKSTRKDKPFVVVDCGAVSTQLIQSELFGHKKGSFTGATEDRKGAFEAADGGTLFLDEIGELPMALQPVLLRALDGSAITRVGENRPRKVKVRLVAATNRDLRCEANKGSFREDLYYRLSRLPITIPPLRERRGDIPALATLFARRYLGDESYRLDADLLIQWSRAPWPGNVRELKNAVERQLISPTSFSAFESLGEEEMDTSRPFREAKEIALGKWARGYISAVLGEHAGKIGLAAEAIGIDRNHMRRLMKRYDIN